MILNLAYPEKSEIKFTVSKFPDGQQSITLDTIPYGDPVTIKSRLNSFQDLELIICANQALKNLNSSMLVTLYVPYFLGARSDRQFEKGGINYLKQVICPIINSQNFNQVTVLDPHSDVLEACLNNFKKENTNKLIDFVLKDYFINKKGVNTIDYSKLLLLSPDAGALKKIYGVAEYMGYKHDIIVASKYRNIKTGKIEKTIVPMLPNDADKDIFIIDDICDGGRTFIEVAKSIELIRKLSSSVRPEEYGKNYLIVTHGIFSAGYEQLGEYFETIYTTNSVKDIREKEYCRLETITTKLELIPSKVKQVNVF
jgi:ribose-phosphate pyrophosphokinase